MVWYCILGIINVKMCSFGVSLYFSGGYYFPCISGNFCLCLNCKLCFTNGNVIFCSDCLPVGEILWVCSMVQKTVINVGEQHVGILSLALFFLFLGSAIHVSDSFYQQFSSSSNQKNYSFYTNTAVTRSFWESTTINGGESTLKTKALHKCS